MFDGPLSEKTEKSKCAYLLIWTSDKGHETFEILHLWMKKRTKLNHTLQNSDNMLHQRQTACLLDLYSIKENS